MSTLSQNAMSSFQMKDIQPFEYVEDYILPMDESFLQLWNIHSSVPIFFKVTHRDKTPSNKVKSSPFKKYDGI